MKKTNTIGNYNITAAKTAMKHNGSTIFCHVSEDNKIYVTNGYVLFTLSPDEYDEIIRPIAKSDPGDWTVSPAGKCKSDNARLAILFDNTVDACPNREPLTKSPLMMLLKDNKNIGAFFYSSEQFACFNADFINAFADFEIRYSGEMTGAVAYNKTGEPFALVMPIRLNPSLGAAERAVRAFNAPADTQNTEAKLAADLAQKDARIAELEKALTEAQNAST